jgi:hypothetical protein
VTAHRPEIDVVANHFEFGAIATALQYKQYEREANDIFKNNNNIIPQWIS